jgi:hypothetical protein
MQHGGIYDTEKELGKMELKDLKAGDKVIVSGRWDRAIKEVQKITPAGYIKVGGRLYNLDGSQRGGDFYSRFQLEIATPELIRTVADEILIKTVLNHIHNVKKLTIEQARAIAAILTEDVEPKSGTELIHCD